MASLSILLLLANLIVFLNEVNCGVDSLEDPYPHSGDEHSHLDNPTGTVSKRAKDEHARIDKPNTNRQPATVNKRTKVFTVYAADTNKLSWTEAYLYCRAIDTHLASVENHEEYLILKDKLSKLPAVLVQNKRFWLGAGRDNSFEWIWTDSGRVLNFTPWANNQPSSQGFCLEVSSGRDGKSKNPNDQNPFNGGPQLYSRPCDKFNNFICHSFITTRSPAGAPS